MTRVQIIIVVAIMAVIAAIAIPRAVKISRISQAERDVLEIAKGFSQYRIDTDQECKKIEDLIMNPEFRGGWDLT